VRLLLVRPWLFWWWWWCWCMYMCVHTYLSNCCPPKWGIWGILSPLLTNWVPVDTPLEDQEVSSLVQSSRVANKLLYSGRWLAIDFSHESHRACITPFLICYLHLMKIHVVNLVIQCLNRFKNSLYIHMK
jgi:hypothetical protein